MTDKLSGRRLITHHLLSVGHQEEGSELDLELLVGFAEQIFKQQYQPSYLI